MTRLLLFQQEGEGYEFIVIDTMDLSMDSLAVEYGFEPLLSQELDSLPAFWTQWPTDRPLFGERRQDDPL